MVYGSCLGCRYLQLNRFKDSKETKDYLAFRQYGCAKHTEGVPGGVPLKGTLRNIDVKSHEHYLDTMGCSNFKEKEIQDDTKGFKQLSIFDL